MKDLGAKAFSYGYASPVLMAATYNDDGTVNVMNLCWEKMAKLIPERLE